MRRVLTIPESALPLDPGEREAIALAIELSADVIVLDELAGRRSAAQHGLDVIGSAGLLIEARRRGLIAAVRPELEAMVSAGLYVSTRLYREILMASGELAP